MEFESLITFVGIIAGTSSLSAAIYSILKAQKIGTPAYSGQASIAFTVKNELKKVLEPFLDASKDAKTAAYEPENLVSAIGALKDQLSDSSKIMNNTFMDFAKTNERQVRLFQDALNNFITKISVEFENERQETITYISTLKEEREKLVYRIMELTEANKLLAHKLDLISNELKMSKDYLSVAEEPLKKIKYDVFISYISNDLGIAENIKASFEKAGIKTFFATREIDSGAKWSDVLRKGMVESSEVCIVLTPKSINSPWVMAEFGMAFGLEKRIVPLMVGVDINSIPTTLRNFQSVDINNLERYIAQIRQRMKEMADKRLRKDGQ